MDDHAITGEQLAAITREMVRIKSQESGRGAAEAKTYLCDDFLFCVLKGGLTRMERNLVDHGEHRLVREGRLRFQEINASTFQGAVERITGRRVLTYESQVLFSPDYTIEIFVLGDAQSPGSTASGEPG